MNSALEEIFRDLKHLSPDRHIAVEYVPHNTILKRQVSVWCESHEEGLQMMIKLGCPVTYAKQVSPTFHTLEGNFDTNTEVCIYVRGLIPEKEEIGA